MATIGSTVKVDLESFVTPSRGKTEIRERMESLDVGFGFSVSGEGVEKSMKTARYAASNITQGGRQFAVYWNKKGAEFTVVRTK